MTSHEFTFILDRDPTDDEVDALFEPFQGDAIPEFGGTDAPVVHVTQDGDSLPAAILAALGKVEKVGFTVVGVEQEDAVTLRDISHRTGRSYESVRLIRDGKRGQGDFPAPIASGVWSWATVAEWFGREVADYDREIAAADYLIRARHILTGDERRHQFADLVDA